MTNISIPKEQYTLIEFWQRDLPGFATVNTALKAFEPKPTFPWHLSLLVQCVDLVDNRLPSPGEQQCLYTFEDKLHQLIERSCNAVFLARVTHDARRELIWRIRDPEVANSILQDILQTKNHPRAINYRMEEDPEWQKASWYLSNATAS
jgi:hypothetical protein